jgi:hypothetical protein
MAFYAFTVRLSMLTCSLGPCAGWLCCTANSHMRLIPLVSQGQHAAALSLQHCVLNEFSVELSQSSLFTANWSRNSTNVLLFTDLFPQMTSWSSAWQRSGGQRAPRRTEKA